MERNLDRFIEIKNISFSHGDRPPLFENLSLGLEKDEITVLIGENGSGKTTLAKLVMGMLKPNTGVIFLDGEKMEDLSLGRIGMKVGFVFQNPDHQIFGATVMDQLLWSFEFLKEDLEAARVKAKVLLKSFDLEGAGDTYPYYLSLGEKRILSLASVLMRNPEYLILDEPTSSLDEDRTKVLIRILKDLNGKGIGMLIITHDEGFVDMMAMRTVRLSEGRVYSD